MNCSYETLFDGPHFVCNTSNTNVTSDPGFLRLPGGITIYNGTYLIPGSPEDSAQWTYNYSSVYLATLWSPTAISANLKSCIITQRYTRCFPYVAQYTLSNKYQNGVQNLTVSTVPKQPIVSFATAANPFGIVQILGSKSSATESVIPTAAINWTSLGFDRYCDLILLNIMRALGHSLSPERAYSIP